MKRYQVTLRRLLALSGAAGAIFSTGVLMVGASTPNREYDQGPLRFTYPHSWRDVEHYTELTNFSSVIVFLSNQKLHAPCTRTKTPEVSSTHCGWPVSRLKPDGILAEWSTSGSPSWTIDDAPGTLQMIGGVQVTCPGSSQAIGGQETISAVVKESVPNNYYSFMACMRGPNLARTTSSMMASLRSTQFSKGA